MYSRLCMCDVCTKERLFERGKKNKEKKNNEK